MWRIQAKLETVCPCCKGYIKKGSWIVQEQGASKWAHAACPADIRHAKNEPKEPTTYTEFVPNADGNLIEVTRKIK